MGRGKKSLDQLRGAVFRLCPGSHRFTDSLHSSHRAAVGGVAGLRYLQYLLAHQATGLSVRLFAHLCHISSLLPLALFSRSRAVNIPEWGCEPIRVSNPHAAGVSGLRIHQPRASRDGQNLSSLYWTKSVLLRARLLSRWG